MLGRAAVAALLALAGLGALPWASPYEEGQIVRLQGSVADRAGRALADVEVALEAGRGRTDWRSFRRETELRRVTTLTDERGQFALDWPWDSSYRSFELVATVRVSAAGREVASELARLDVRDRLRGEPAVTATLTVERPGYVDRLRDFVGSIASDDERRVFAELGVPESVDRVESPAGVESAWWYFEAGRVARFRDGALIETQEFDPIRPIDQEPRSPREPPEATP